jgi:hypothetical protein
VTSASARCSYGRWAEVATACGEAHRHHLPTLQGGRFTVHWETSVQGVERGPGELAPRWFLCPCSLGKNCFVGCRSGSLTQGARCLGNLRNRWAVHDGHARFAGELVALLAAAGVGVHEVSVAGRPLVVRNVPPARVRQTD